MSVEKSPDSMNKRHYAFGMLPLTLSVSGWVNVAGLGWQVIQLMLALTLFMFSGNAMANNREHQQIALVGTWTHIPDAPAVQKPAFPSEGLYRLRVNVDGTLTLLNVIKMKSPSWIVKSRDGRFAYVTNEEDAGTVTALAIDDAGSVRVLNTVSSAGRQPTHATTGNVHPCHTQPGRQVSVCRQLLRRQWRRGGDGIADSQRRHTG